MESLNLDKLREHKTAIAGAVGAGLAATALYYIVKRTYSSKVRQGKFKGASLPDGTFDAVIVGAGPSGSTCAYYLAKTGAKVALIDKETFPRDKYCGDAVYPAPRDHYIGLIDQKSGRQPCSSCCRFRMPPADL